MKISEKLVHRAGSVSSATMISRVLGYARDALVAHAFGGGYLTDAFYAAFRLPNLFRRVLGEGALTSAFVPAFTEELSKGNREEANRFFYSLLSVLFVVLVAVVGLGVLFAPQLTYCVAWGFKTDPGKYELTVQLTRLMFPFLLFVCLAAISCGALNTLGFFFVPALAPAMLSVAEITFVLLLAKLWNYSLMGLALSAVVGGALHFGILLPLMRRKGILPKWHWNPMHQKVRQVGKAIVPAMWGLSVDQVNAFFDTICASFLAVGSVTALYNSNRLMQLPLALFGIAMSTAALPSLSAFAARQDFTGMKETLNNALRIVIFTVMPAAVGLMVLGIPIIQVLFEHGKFTFRETLLTHGALVGYAVGLPAFAGAKVMISSFYAMKDVKTPVHVATYCLLINMAGNLALMWTWGVGGLAFATSLASVVNVTVLFWLFRRRMGLMGGRRLLRTFVLSSLACAGMACVAGGMNYFVPGSIYWRLPVMIVAGMAAYVIFVRVLKMEEYREVLNLMRKS